MAPLPEGLHTETSGQVSEPEHLPEGAHVTSPHTTMQTSAMRPKVTRPQHQAEPPCQPTALLASMGIVPPSLVRGHRPPPWGTWRPVVFLVLSETFFLIHWQPSSSGGCDPLLSSPLALSPLTLRVPILCRWSLQQQGAVPKGQATLLGA